MAGFEKTVRPNIKVDVNENATVNFTLKVGASTQAVEVQGVAQGVATEDAETGQVVDRRFINDLPILSRNVVALTSLAPASPRWTISVERTVPARTSSPTAAADPPPTS
jgi:hypothetical protein